MNRKTIFWACAGLLILAGGTAGAEQKIKKGWNFGVVPAVSYNSDLGFQYGVTADIFNYGDGSDFPQYHHKFNVEVSRYTKGTTRLHLMYDSKFLIPGIRMTTALTYSNNPMYSFYGFNGTAEVYDPSLNSGAKEGKQNNKELIGMSLAPNAYYNYKRNQFRFLADFQGRVADNLNWAAGLAFWSYDLGQKKGSFRNDKKDYEYSDFDLYNVYRASGLIRENEEKGGNELEFKAGLVYDTRDLESAPSRGIWSDICLYGAPDLFGSGYSYLKLSAHFRHYVPVWRDRLTFAYHLAYQGTLAGEAPFYMQQNINTIYLKQIMSEGLGSINTVRGCLFNRFIGAGYAWGNFELRAKIVDFNFINQSWYVAVNPFFDLGAIVQPYRVKEMAAMKGVSESDLRREATRLHESAGLGVKLVMNQNFIISAELAKPFQKQDNPGMGVNIGLNYIF